MALVKISRGADIQHNYVNGVSRVSILEGAYKDATVERISLQPGADFSAELYTREQHNQVFLITAGKGYIFTPAVYSTSPRSPSLSPTSTRRASPSTAPPMPRRPWRSSTSSPSSTTTTKPA